MPIPAKKVSLILKFKSVSISDTDRPIIDCRHTHTHTHTHTHNHFMVVWILSGITQVSRYQKKPFIHSGLSWSSIIPYLLPPSITIHGNLRAWQSFFTVSLQVFFGLPLGLALSTSHSIVHTFLHPIIVFFSQHIPYHRKLVYCSTKIMSSNHSLPQPFT